MQVALTTFAFFHIGLDEIARLACFAMAGIAFGKLGLDEFRSGIFDHFIIEASNECGEKIFVSDDEPRIQKGCTDRHVFARKTNAFVDIACRMADFQPHVPEHVEHIFGDLFAPWSLLIRQ